MLKHPFLFHLFRQILVIIGSLVLCGVLPGYFLSPWWFILREIVGIGMIFPVTSMFYKPWKILNF